MGKQPNGTTVPEIRHDEHGNLISCPECKSKKIKKEASPLGKTSFEKDLTSFQVEIH